mgnify:CR=1 FL=1
MTYTQMTPDERFRQQGIDRAARIAAAKAARKAAAAAVEAEWTAREADLLSSLESDRAYYDRFPF